ncbi:hypothetical protein [Erythrobacter sp. JK5]|uniref:hypothetical protein n=1 Tax=Erythrobacter sp. JK5 TaxID=2829500 RepID=UPI001BA45FFF|nr:hypothetical protein [Erythrobacter sp. JK5]QUL38461.1 hypothetical protein KDC96_03385 [Erythrobacter sp. JK5]
MPSLYAIAAPFALILPLIGQSAAVPVALAGGELSPVGEQDSPEQPSPSIQQDRITPVAGVANPLNALRDSQIVRQVRIEQRVIVRISPARGENRNNLLASLPQQSITTKFEERKMEKCVPVSGIAGVQTGSGNRLLLFLRDRRIVTANLEKSCRARDFYSGFYVEKNKDGKLCVDRDKLQSRTGAKCEVERMRQLVAVKE